MRGLFILALLLPAAVFGLPTSSKRNVPRAFRQRSEVMTRNEATHHLKSAVNNKSLTCVFCAAVVEGIQALLEQDATEQVIDDFLVKACNSLNIEQPYVCDHIINEYAYELYFVVERSIFTPHELCGALMSDCGQAVNPLTVMWNITIPGGKPPVKPWPVPTNPQKKLRVLHLSDIHIDRQYAEGSEANCTDDNGLNTYALCCRDYPSSGAAPKAIKSPAGHWGTVDNCDIPYRTFESAMKHISETHKDLDYIIITGDKEAHDSWDYAKDLTKSNIENITAVLLNYFPGKKIYEAVGNHEGVPQDSMAPHSMDEYEKRGPQWLYTILAQTWSNWINPEAVNDVQYRASYAEHPAPGLKLISLNTVYCAVNNYYLYIDQRDPDNTLEWLIDELLDSEAKGEKVHIISHIPAGDDYCLKGWAHNFYEVVNRFENTIAAQYYGHTHQDHFQVYYENSDINGRPTHVNFISPSLTTYQYNNPAYRIYTIDGGYEGATYTTLESETYSTDLAAANAAGKEPVWTFEYNLRDTFGMADLSPASWNALANKLATDDELFKKFTKYYWRSPHNADCYKDKACRDDFICQLKSAKSHEQGMFCKGHN